ncbi:hypothetical protein [Bacillus benzoevorans]|uniref:Uncharacterized protein n=1 Tax=Bacillus benzoevorans TaxID=1456 RepID=A0A7X0LUL6_9BACI|nr:hypothetical protein [Bacillus benzoevorans]MBB6443697.1 hypothetical protein [Bacillus benzoevorans]
MESIQDAVYNWLTIKVVSDARPRDLAAVETEKMFFSILETEHALADITIEKDEQMYYVSFIKGGKQEKLRFPRDLIEVMMNQINEAPDRYTIYPE